MSVPVKYAPPKPPQVVVWFPSPGMTPTTAIVTRTGRDAIDVAVVVPDSRSVLPKDGVKYVGDPRIITNGYDPEVGLWDYTQESKQLRELVQEFLTPSEK